MRGTRRWLWAGRNYLLKVNADMGGIWWESEDDGWILEGLEVSVAWVVSAATQAVIKG